MRLKLLLLLIVVVVAVAVAGASIFLFVSNYTFHDQSAIHFGASLSTTTVAQGQDVRVNLEDWNTLDFKNVLPLSDSLSDLNLSVGPCGSVYPGGIAVYKGAYDLSNVSSASPVPFYEPGSYFICSPMFATNSFSFGPLENVTTYFDLQGYYTSGTTPLLGGGVTVGVLHPYLPGIYTVIAGDPLGSTKVMYFHVTATTGDQERAGPVTSFPASWLNPCNASATGNVTTSVYLDLNGSSPLDHINLNQVYALVVNSSNFVYLSIGHGWVVSEWSEIEYANDGGAGQVIISFILTSGDKPSGYFFAYYDPASGTGALSSVTSASSESCPA